MVNSKFSKNGKVSKLPEKKESKENTALALENSFIKGIIIASVYFFAICISFSFGLVELQKNNALLSSVIQNQNVLLTQQNFSQAANAKQSRQIIHNQNLNQHSLNQHTNDLQTILKSEHK